MYALSPSYKSIKLMSIHFALLTTEPGPSV